jgi:DNA-binding winged helix-turn-helix (wHTH) protein
MPGHTLESIQGPRGNAHAGTHIRDPTGSGGPAIPVADAILRFADLVIDPMARRVSCGADEIPLTRREFDVLLTLASHPGWVYSCETLAPNEPTVCASPGSVNVHISHLRAKLGAVGRAGIIETVRGVGYRFRVTGEGFSSLDARGGQAVADPFIGRQSEMLLLESALSAAMDGQPRFVLITGEPGIGKTRLAEEMVARAPGSVLTAWGRCQPAGSPPYWLWTQVLRAIIEQSDGDSGVSGALLRHGEVLGVILPEIGPRRPAKAGQAPPRPDQSIFALCESVAGFLREAARSRPLLVVLDDLQWGSAPSLPLLEFAVRHLCDDRVMIVGICRDHECGGAVLDVSMGECSPRRRSVSVDLSGFSMAEVVAFAASHGIEGLSPEMAEAVAVRTSGNPFYVSELVKMIGSAGVDMLRPDELDQLAPSRGVRAFVRSRVARLSPQCVDVLRMAAVFGPTFPIAALERAVGLERADLLAVLSEALEARIVTRTDTPDVLGFAHALVQQAVHLDVPIAERPKAHARVAEALAETASEADPATAAIAYHYERAAPAGYADRAIEYLLRAAREGALRCAFQDSVLLCEQALTLVASLREPDSRGDLMAEVQEAYGDALAATATVERAAVAYRLALDVATGLDAATKGRLYGKLAAVLIEIRDWEGAFIAVDRAGEELDAVPKTDRDDAWNRSWVNAGIRRMWLYYYQLMGEEMQEHLSRTGPLIEKRADPGQLADYLSVVVLWRILADANWPTDETVEVARNALAAATASGSRTRAAMAESLLGYVLIWGGRLAEAGTRMDHALSTAEPAGAYTAMMIALAGLSIIARLQGDLEGVAERAPAVEAAARRLGGWYEFGALGTADLAWLAWRKGDLAGARELARAAREVWDRVPAFQLFWEAVWPELAACLELGEDAVAIECARKLMEPGQQLPRGEVARLVAGALEAADSGDEARAAELLRQAVAAGREFGYT